jgi:hypothetical protein
VGDLIQVDILNSTPAHAWHWNQQNKSGCSVCPEPKPAVQQSVFWAGLEHQFGQIDTLTAFGQSCEIWRVYVSYFSLLEHSMMSRFVAPFNMATQIR